MNVLNIMGCIVLLSMFGCGGGGGGTSSTLGSVFPTVSGTASEGALITGKTVKLKDANGKSAVDTTTDATTGNYSFDVSGFTAPFLVTVTGANGTYVSLAQTAGKANINPITTSVVALAAGKTDVSALFESLTSVELTTINTNYAAKTAMITTSLQAALPAGVKAEDYFKGAVTAGKGMDAVFDNYQFSVNSTAGITVKTKDAAAATVLNIPAATVTANTAQPLPAIFAPVANATTPQNFVVVGTIVPLDGSGSSDPNGAALTYKWEITFKPPGSNAELSSTTNIKPAFTPDVEGIYAFSLIVNNQKLDSIASILGVFVNPNKGSVSVGW